MSCLVAGKGGGLGIEFVPQWLYLTAALLQMSVEMPSRFQPCTEAVSQLIPVTAPQSGGGAGGGSGPAGPSGGFGQG